MRPNAAARTLSHLLHAALVLRLSAALTLWRQPDAQRYPFFPNAANFTGDACESDDQCACPRNCYANGTECISGTTCECLSDEAISCKSSADCATDWRCISYNTSRTVTECFRCSNKPRQLPPDARTLDSGNCVCIAVDSLPRAYRTAGALVFREHRRAAVLCDHAGNCATPGHVVVHASRPMSMAAYCARLRVPCTRSVKLVNSPRMKLGLRIPSRSSSLQFTAFAAARTTRIEQSFLNLLVALGA